MNSKIIFYLWGLLLTTSISQISAQENNVTVFIYHDVNNNGQKDPDEELLAGFSLQVTDSEGNELTFTEDEPGIFKGNISSRTRVIVQGYDDQYKVGNAAGAGSAPLFFIEPEGGEYFVGVSTKLEASPGEQTIIIPSFMGGPSEGRDDPALFEFGFKSDGITQNLGGDAPDPEVLATKEQIGSTWGVTAQSANQKVYTSAIVKRHVGLGPMGTGGLYQYDRKTGELRSYDLSGMRDQNGNVLNFGVVDRKVVGGKISHSGSDDNALTKEEGVATYDIDAFPKVAKSGFGSMALTEDESTLWMVNVYDRSLIAVDVSGEEPDFESILRYPILEMQGLPDTKFAFRKNINTGYPDTVRGAASFVDHHRVAWERNRYHQGGEGRVTTKDVDNTMNASEGTSEAQLYQTYRVGKNFSYN